MVGKPFCLEVLPNLLFLLDSLFHYCENALPERSARTMATKDEAKNKKLPSLSYDHKPSSYALISYLIVNFYFRFELLLLQKKKQAAEL